MKAPAAPTWEKGVSSICVHTIPPLYRAWAFDERTDSLSGPFGESGLTAAASLPNSSELKGCTQEGALVKTDLLDLKESSFPVPDSDWDLPSSYSHERDWVVANEEGQFSYEGRYLGSPFADIKEGAGHITNPIFFDDAILAVFETNPSHLRAGEHSVKQVHEIIYRFAPGSFGHLWCFVKNDRGQVKGQYKGSIWKQEKVKAFVNIRGRNFSIKTFIVTKKSNPWLLREISVGHLLGNAV